MLTHFHKPLRAAAPLAALALLLAVPSAAESKVVFKVRGAGFGHGVGMSQWGAYGQAREGRGHKRILRHYYRGTTIGRAPARQVRVLLTVRDGFVAFTGARRACGKSLKPGRTYRADLERAGRRVRLERANGKAIANCDRRLTARPSNGKIRIDQEGKYRGRMIARVSGGDLNVINKVRLDDYIKGVVPNEVPASWPDAALRAQAVAARSYALATGVDGDGFDFYDDVRSQVYGGVDTEEGSTNRAVRATSREVVQHNGETIPAFFSSSSGGITAEVEAGFPGAEPRPYLKAVRDPWDRASPYHRWKLRFTRAELEGRLGDLVEGRLRDIRVTKRGRSPRIVQAKVIGTGGNRRVSGDDLRFRLGLRSAWAKFKRIRR